MDRALIITLSNIGDLVMTTPVMEAVAKLLRPKSMDVLADARSSELLQHTPYVSTIFHRFKRASVSEQLALFRHLRSIKYDLVVDLRTSFLPYLLRSKHRCVKRKKFFFGLHSVEQHYSSIAGTGKFPSKIPNCKIYLDKSHLVVADTLTGELPVGRWLAIAPGANWAGKKWSGERYGILIKRALDSKVFDAVLIVGSKEDLADDLTASFRGQPVLDLRGRTGLNLAAAVLSKAALFVGNDSGLGHVANAVGVRTLTLFGPGEPDKYRPWGDNAKIVIAPNLDLNLLSVPDVWCSVQLILDEQT